MIRAIDDFAVKSVFVRLEKPDGTLVEEGSATDNVSQWEYIAAVINPDIVGCKLIITATDLPENETIKEVLL